MRYDATNYQFVYLAGLSIDLKKNIDILFLKFYIRVQTESNEVFDYIIHEISGSLTGIVSEFRKLKLLNTRNEVF